MTTESGGRATTTDGVLAGLDSQARRRSTGTWRCLRASAGSSSIRLTADIGSALGFIPYHLSEFATGYLVAGASLGAAVGALAAGPLTDRFGRKSLLIADAAIYALGAILSALAVNSAMLLGARTLIGLAVGADSAIATAYIAEFAPPNRRGSLMIIQQWMITVGILVSYIVAVVILKVAPGSAGGADWRIILGLGAVPAIVALALRTRMPESPRWLMLTDATRILRRASGHWGMDVTEEQVREIAEEPCRDRTPAGDEDAVDPWCEASLVDRLPLFRLSADQWYQHPSYCTVATVGRLLPVRARPQSMLPSLESRPRPYWVRST